jgi:hypothetical protein
MENPQTDKELIEKLHKVIFALRQENTRLLSIGKPKVEVMYSHIGYEERVHYYADNESVSRGGWADDDY